MLKIVLSISYIVSSVFLPWWVTVALGIALVVHFKLWWVAILGGLLMDLVFGAPIAALGGFAYLFSLLFVVLSLLALMLRQRMLE